MCNFKPWNTGSCHAPPATHSHLESLHLFPAAQSSTNQRSQKTTAAPSPPCPEPCRCHSSCSHHSLSAWVLRAAPRPGPSPWETMVTLILARLEALVLEVGLGLCCLFSCTRTSSLSAPSECSEDTGTGGHTRSCLSTQGVPGGEHAHAHSSLHASLPMHPLS